MSNLITKDNLQLASQRSRTFTSEKILELTEAMIQDLQEFSELMNFYTTSGLCLDADGDIAQDDVAGEEEEEEESGNGEEIIS